MNSKHFLLLGGVVLILVGVLGFVGVTGPTATDSLFGDKWVFDNAENWAHLVLGIVGVIAGLVLPAMAQRPLVLLLGVVAVVIGIYSAMGGVYMGKNLLGAQLQNPTDTVLHLVVGAWALFCGFYNKGMKHAG